MTEYYFTKEAEVLIWKTGNKKGKKGKGSRGGPGHAALKMKYQCRQNNREYKKYVSWWPAERGGKNKKQNQIALPKVSHIADGASEMKAKTRELLFLNHMKETAPDVSKIIKITRDMFRNWLV